MGFLSGVTEKPKYFRNILYSEAITYFMEIQQHYAILSRIA